MFRYHVECIFVQEFDFLPGCIASSGSAAIYCFMSDDGALIKLKHLHAKSEKIRRQLRISSPNSVIFRAAMNPVDAEEVIVEADGFGGARLKLIEGNYPIDFLSLRETKFPTEAKAITAAEQLVDCT